MKFSKKWNLSLPRYNQARETKEIVKKSRDILIKTKFRISGIRLWSTKGGSQRNNEKTFTKKWLFQTDALFDIRFR